MKFQISSYFVIFTSKVTLCPKWASAYNRLKYDSAFEYCENIVANKCSLTVTLLNTRSLKKYAIDIAKESCLMKSDILCLTETQIRIDQDTFNIKQALNDFDVFLITPVNKLFLILSFICIRMYH